MADLNTDRFIEGNLSDPSRVEIPGFQDSAGGTEIPIFYIGEDIPFKVPDPGVRGMIKLTVRNRDFASRAVFEKEVFHEIASPTTVVIPGEVTSRLSANGYFWDTFLTFDDGIRFRTQRLNHGFFSLQQSVGSLVLPTPEEEALELAGASTVLSQGEFYIDIPFAGSAVVGVAFGYFKNTHTNPVLCSGMQISIQEAPQGGSLVVDLKNIGTNILQGSLGILGATQIYSQTSFGVPVRMEPGSEWQLQWISIGTTDPGSYANVRLLLKDIPA